MEFFDHLPSPAVCLDPDTKLLRINRRGLQLFNWSREPEEIVLFDNLIIAEDRESFRSYFRGLDSSSNRGFNGRITTLPTTFSDPLVSKQTVHIVGSRTPDGSKILMLNRMFDNTTGCECRCAYTTILDAQYQLNPGGILLVNENLEILSYNREFINIWDIPEEIQQLRDDAASLRSILSKLVDPDAFLDKVYRLYDNPEESGTDELELLDGRMLLRHTYPVYTDSRYLGRVWYFLDITPLKKAQNKIEQQQVFLNAILEHIEDSIIACNESGEISISNPASERLLALQTGGAGNSGDKLPPYTDILLSKIMAGHTLKNERLTVDAPDGNFRTLRVNGKTMHSRSGNKLGAVVSLHDITDLENVRRQLRHMAYHDALTNLPNRRLFQDLLKHSLKQAHRNNKQVGILFLDLDNFKEINDKYGHDEGDILLITISKKFKEFLRGSDILCRWGGDEFVIALLEAENSDDILSVADKLCKLTMACLPQESNTLKMSVSIGISIYPEHGVEPDVLIRNADSAMYLAKRSGKNRCILYDSDVSRNGKAIDTNNLTV